MGQRYKKRAMPGRYTAEEISNIRSIGEKKCTACGLVKPLHDFPKQSSRRLGIHAQCKACASLRFKEYRQKNIDRMKLYDRITHYVKKYGLSREDALELVRDRVGACDICGNKGKLNVDHHHTTGLVRGMLCYKCNTMLGFAEDDIDSLKKAIAYLEKYHG
jgi:hypothetical protein